MISVVSRVSSGKCNAVLYYGTPEPLKPRRSFTAATPRPFSPLLSSAPVLLPLLSRKLEPLQFISSAFSLLETRRKRRGGAIAVAVGRVMQPAAAARGSPDSDPDEDEISLQD